MTKEAPGMDLEIPSTWTRLECTKVFVADVSLFMGLLLGGLSVNHNAVTGTLQAEVEGILGPNVQHLLRKLQSQNPEAEFVFF